MSLSASTTTSWPIRSAMLTRFATLRFDPVALRVDHEVERRAGNAARSRATTATPGRRVPHAEHDLDRPG